MGRGDDVPLFPASLFEYRNRPTRDFAYGVIYLVALLASWIGGIVAYSKRNPRYTKLTSTDHINNPKSCPVNGGRRLLEQPQSDEFEFSKFLVMAGIWIVVSFIGSTIIGIIFLYLFKNRANAMVKFTVIVQTAIPAIVGIAALAAGAIVAGIILLVSAALTALAFYVWRDRLPLVARLISVSAKSLEDNPAVVYLVVALKFLLAAVTIPMLFSMVVANMNGALARNPAAVNTSGQCTNADGNQVPCCVWDTDNWVPPYLAFCSVVLTWTVFLVFEIKVYTISGTVAQWYFAPVGTQTFAGNVTRSFRHAIGSSFGSLCLGSGILTLVHIIRSAADRARREDPNSIGACLIACVVNCIAGLIEFITKFATIWAAISGEGFFTSGRSAFGLLKRNFLNTVAVWWLPPLVLQTCCLILSVAWGVAIGLISYAAWAGHPNATLSAVLLGLIAGAFCLTILSFFASVLLNVIDAVYICFAMDREHRAYTKPEVHEVFSQLPNVGPVVENPDGGMSYAAPVGGAYSPPPPQGYPGASPPQGYSAPVYTAEASTQPGYNPEPLPRV